MHADFPIENLAIGAGQRRLLAIDAEEVILAPAVVIVLEAIFAAVLLAGTRYAVQQRVGCDGRFVGTRVRVLGDAAVAVEETTTSAG